MWQKTIAKGWSRLLQKAKNDAKEKKKHEFFSFFFTKIERI